MRESKRTFAVILAGGVGARMGAAVPKQELSLLGKSILSYSVEAFASANTIDGLVLVVREGEEPFAKSLLSGCKKPALVVTGGAFRAESARLGVLAAEADFVAIHDAARPLIHPDDIDRVVMTAWEHGAASAVTPVFDTVKAVDGEGRILQTLSRDTLRLASTPQVFSRALYCRALDAVDTAPSVTDDNMLIEALGEAVKGVELLHSNPKITTKEDLLFAEFLLGGKASE